jgi:hypothetical protein
MQIGAILNDDLREGDGLVFVFIAIFLPVLGIVKAPDLAVLDDIAEHNNTLNLVLPDHLLELFLCLLERPLGDDQFSRVREGDPVGVDIALSF